ncbi:single-stranded DNA-binding protein [Planctomonas sp. JC2975]|uniref:single-stranded DNA-binding protein n=1 Tax=Planctomonas sp. JC2975 TaxID=2729626 RepID=UPI001472BF39|nr:single-stranded DNA-binding protein [Planctomonas sp. JC2975]NNC12844.1 single-stranded DNA-binding protein [Planctomonas sp. JC2975]
MSSKVPITIEGNLTANPAYGETDNGVKYAKFTVAVTDRKLQDGEWVDAGVQYHRATVFGRTAENVRDSLGKGDPVLVTGNLEFRHWTDETSQESRVSTEILADAVGPSLRYNTARLDRHVPKADGPAIDQTGPSMQRSTPAASAVEPAF